MKAEAFNMCEPSVCSFMLQLLSLANVLGCSIYSIYPEVNKAIRPLLNGYIRPAHIDSLNENVFYVMWSCDGNLDSRPGALFQPNHFCLVIQDVCIEPKNPNQNKRKAHKNEADKKKMRATATGKQQTLFSFLKKSSKDTNDESKHKQASDHPSGSRAEASSDDIQETDTTEGKKASTSEPVFTKEGYPVNLKSLFLNKTLRMKQTKMNRMNQKSKSVQGSVLSLTIPSDHLMRPC